MAQYYYNKYVADEDYTYSNPNSSWIYKYNLSGYVGGKESYGWNSTSGFFLSGSNITGEAYAVVYLGGGSYVQQARNNESYDRDIYQKNCDKDTNYSQGDLIQENIIAEDGTYPDNDEQDGFWWVKGSLVETTSGFLAFFL